MSDIDKSVPDFTPVLDGQETDIEYIIRGLLANRDKYSYAAIKKIKDRKSFEEIFGKTNIVTQDSFVITGNSDAEFSLNIPLVLLLRYDFGNGEVPVLYNLPAFTDIALTSGSIATGGTTNYLYVTFDASNPGTDQFKIYTTTTEPTSDTQLILTTYTATGAPGSYVITVTDIYPNGSLDKDFEEGNDGTETNPDSFFGRIGKKLRDGISKINTTTLNTDTVSEKTSGEGTSIQANSGEQILTKIIDIGDWNMDTTTNKDVAHGITNHEMIRSITVLIRRDGGTGADIFNLYHTDANGGVTPDVAGGISRIDGTDISLTRNSGLLFDSTFFDSTSYNRGWITITYVK